MVFQQKANETRNPKIKPEINDKKLALILTLFSLIKNRLILK